MLPTLTIHEIPDSSSSSSVNLLENFWEAVINCHPYITQEVTEAIMQVENTTPGIDKTAPLIIKIV